MDSTGDFIRRKREQKQLPLRTVADYLAIDIALLSKIERGERKATRDQVVKLATYFKVKENDLLVIWLSEKILYTLGDEEMALKALQVSEEKLAYIAFKKTDRGKLLRHLKKGIQKYPEVQKAWIYGSFARGDDGPGSDIDIAFKTDAHFSYFDLADIQFHLEKLVPRKIDVGFIDSFKSYILEHVKPDLKLIYER